MIGAVFGGTPSMRLGALLKDADLEALSGRRVVVLSSLPEVPPVSGCSPRLLAPSFEQSHPVDIAAECYAAVSGAEAAASLFAEGCLSTEGASVNRTSNDRHWSGNLRLGLQNLFRASGILSAQNGNSLVRTLTDCVDDMNSLAGDRSEFKSSSKAPRWMDALPQEIRRHLEGIYLKGHSDTVRSNFRTLMPLLEEIRATAPDMWTEPLLADPDGEPLFVHTPDWGEGPLALLLRVCILSARTFFLSFTGGAPWRFRAWDMSSAPGGGASTRSILPLSPFPFPVLIRIGSCTARLRP